MQNLSWYKTGFETCRTKTGFVPAPKPALYRSLTNRSKTGFVPTLNQLLQNQNRLCACSKTGFVPTLNQPLQNRLCACSKTGFVPTLNHPLQNRLCACSKPALCRPETCCTKTGFVPTLNLPHQNRLCIGTKLAFSFWINISTVSEVRCDCQGFGLVARIEASILVFDTKQVLYWPVLEQIQFCSFDRRCKTCLDTTPVLYQGRFCSLTTVTLSQEHLFVCRKWMLLAADS